MNVIEQLQISKYNGEIWPVHPNRSDIGGITCFADTQSLPGVPDAAFIGVNRELSVEIIGELNSIDAGGAICFASGYREANEEHQIKNSGYETPEICRYAAMPKRLVSKRSNWFISKQCSLV